MSDAKELKHLCKVCSTSRDVTQESLLDGRHILLCNVCRRYLQGLLRSCETCRDGKECARGYGFAKDEFVCDEWKEKK